MVFSLNWDFSVRLKSYFTSKTGGETPPLQCLCEQDARGAPLRSKCEHKSARHPERSEVLRGSVTSRVKPRLAEGSTKEFCVTFLVKVIFSICIKSYSYKESHKDSFIDSCACYTRLVLLASLRYAHKTSFHSE